MYEKYALIDAQIKTLTAQKDEIKLAIIQEMVDQGVENVKTAVGKFTIAKLKKWTYPDEVLAIGEEFKAAKAAAESEETATFVEEPSLRFTQVKL
jgi:hypothetical protein